MRTTEHVEYLLKQGRRPKELKELGFSKSAITRARRKLEKEALVTETRTVNIPTKNGSQGRVEVPDETTALRRRLDSAESQLEQISHLVKILPKLTCLMASFQEFGIGEREACPHEEDGVCTLLTWDSKTEIPTGIGEPVPAGEGKPEWHVRPSVYYCALCTGRIEDRLEHLEDEADDTPLWRAREQITCSSCGRKGWIATLVKCTKCGYETYWGWWPKTK